MAKGVKVLTSWLAAIGGALFMLAIGIDIGDSAVNSDIPPLAWVALGFWAMAIAVVVGALLQDE